MAQQLVPSSMLSEGGMFAMIDEESQALKQFSSESLDKLSTFSGVLYSSPEVNYEGKNFIQFRLLSIGVGWKVRNAV